MISDSGSPSFCTAGSSTALGEPSPLAARLCDRAAALGWKTRRVDVCASDEIDEVTALVLIADAGTDAVRRCFPHALLVAERALDGADLVVPGNADDAALDALLGHGSRPGT